VRNLKVEMMLLANKLELGVVPRATLQWSCRHAVGCPGFAQKSHIELRHTQPLLADGKREVRMFAFRKAAVAGVMSLGLVTTAYAVDPRVRSACTGDFMAHCSQHDPDSAAARSCMRANGPKLSKGCLNALIAAGEVSTEEVARRERRK
jgi:hypothetical protein